MLKAGLRTKLLVPTILAVIICMGLASYFSSKKAADELWGELVSASRVLSRNLSISAGSFAGDMKAAVVLQAGVQRVRQVLLSPTEANMVSARHALKELVGFDPSVQGVNLLDTKGEVLVSDDPKTKGNFADREYFKQAMKGVANVSEPILSRVTNKPVFIAASPVKDGDTVIGVVYARVDIGKFTEDMVAPVKMGASGYAFVASRSGLIFSHPDKEKVLKFKIGETDWGKKMIETGEGVVDIELEGKKRTIAYSRDKDTGWIAAVSVSEDDIAKASSAVRTTSALFGALGVAMVCGAIIFIVNVMLRDLGSCVAFSEEVAKGNIDRDLPMRRDDELGRLADSLRKMVASLSEMIGTARQKTDEAERQTTLAKAATEEAQVAKTEAESARRKGMLHAAQQLESIVGVITSASQQLTSQIEQSSNGAEQQAARVSETATAMEEMTATVIEVAKNAAQAAETAGNARNKAQDGAQIVGKVVTGMNDVQVQSDHLRTDMGQLGKQAEDIGQIMNVISDIADQTNLLALNAAIEAARAGDAGRGFAVVADEVRKLAEKTMSATKQVGEAIGVIQKSTRQNVDNVDKSVKLIEAATGYAQHAGAALGEIVTLVDTASDQVRSIATASEEQSAASEEINRSIEQVNLISAETSQAMREASQAVAELAEQSQVLQELINKLEQEGKG